MPTPVTTGGGAPGSTGGTAQSTQSGSGNQQQASAPVVPFVRASQAHKEVAFDVTRTLTTSDQDLGVIPIPAYGYLRSLVVMVQCTGAAGGTPVFAEDGPWSMLKNIIFQEPNGATIAQFNSGYELYLANKWGGYRGFNDPRGMPLYNANVAAGVMNPTFMLRIPIELNVRDGLGALPNQNAAATFQLRLTLAAAATAYATAPGTTLPQVRIRVYAEEWDQPAPSGPDGSPQQTTPPVMNTTQFWSTQVYNVGAGQQTVRLTRMGNYIRNMIFAFRATTRAAGAANWPETLTVFYDTRPLEYRQVNLWYEEMFNVSGYGGQVGSVIPGAEQPGGLDNGVFIWDRIHEFDGVLGHENRDQWLPTYSSTRFEIAGNFGAGGILTVQTNDVAVAGNVFL